MDGLDLLLASAATFLVAIVGCLLSGRGLGRPSILVRWVLWAVIGGMVGYILYAVGWIRPDDWFLPGGITWLARASVVGVTVVGALLPLPLLLRGMRVDD